jgi:TolB-like protein/Tfp pilus assembly protein PilF
MNEDSASRDVFVSYASQDAAVANSVIEALERQRIKCWIAPRDVRPGTEYADAIVAAINESKAVVLILSGSAVASSHVGREIERAASKHKPIIAFRIDAAPLSRSLEYFLSNSQWIDVQALGLQAALAKLTEAVSRAPAVPPPKPTTAKGSSGGAMKRAVVAAGFVVALVLGALVFRFWQSKHGDAPPVAAISDKSIAVLPFTDMSQKKDQEYFGDGMAEEILDLLAKIPGLTVIGRTSSFQFKGKNEDLRTIGTKLNAAYVLEGSVRNSGDQVRITAQLINTKTGAHEWSETYDRPIGDVLKLQDAIAAAVVRELQLTVAPGYLSPRSSVRDVEAYDLLLRGRRAEDRYNREGFDEAITLFKQALDRDPASADAAAELAHVYELAGTFDTVGSASDFEQARRSAMTALGLDSNSALAHYVLGAIHLFYDWDWAASEKEFQQTAKLMPGSSQATRSAAELALALGRWDEALRQIDVAIAQDPLNMLNYDILCLIQSHRGQLAEAEAAARRILEVRPNYEWAHYYLGILMIARGDRDAARVMQQETAERGKMGGLSMAYFVLGRKTDSDALLARLTKEHAETDAFQIAEVYAFRGRSDEALYWLDRAYAQKDTSLWIVKGDPPLASLANDSRFKAFLKKMNLPE